MTSNMLEPMAVRRNKKENELSGGINCLVKMKFVPKMLISRTNKRMVFGRNMHESRQAVHSHSNKVVLGLTLLYENYLQIHERVHAEIARIMVKSCPHIAVTSAAGRFMFRPILRILHREFAEHVDIISANIVEHRIFAGIA